MIVHKEGSPGEKATRMLLQLRGDSLGPRSQKEQEEHLWR